jgi:[ribosomal protein S18]-alanine N-acetyltransferase
VRAAHSTVLIRPATEHDAAAIAAIEHASFIHPGERFSLRRVRYLIRSPRVEVIVAEEKGGVLGWAAGFARLRARTPWSRVHAVAVDPGARGRNIGRMLTEHIIDVLVKRGAVRIFLEARADNHAALRLYQKLGFAECGMLPNYYGHGVAAIRMVRIMASSPAASP